MGDHNIDKGDDSLILHVPEYVVDHALEGCRGIDKAEGHDCIFEQPVSASEGGLPFVTLLNSDEVVTVLEVDFCEPIRSSNAFLEFIHVRKGVAIGDSNLVKTAVVNA